jgi:hypothetical protein
MPTGALEAVLQPAVFDPAGTFVVILAQAQFKLAHRVTVSHVP